ncbi:iron ABC transporter permease [Actinobacillus delphinicola]|uniref:metal ABC transporter permease n=1 Tax=Actinobacillus delphinicola TaxID=51161 RepID=UPI00244128F0|nr:metal ABC transporter permease [Actinobacillus delphinicola]MDG6896712.1 iron ABC transporter permease [Actinobacillus delphinicola]
MSWIVLLSEPFTYPFMQRALFVAVIVATISAILSCYLVLKGWALMGDALSHAVLPGIVIVYLLNLPLIIGAFLSGIFCAFSMGYIKQHSRLKEDTVMGIVFAGMFAFGLVLFSKIESEQHLLHILFGNILGITRGDFYQTLIISAIVILVLLLKGKDFVLFCFDPNYCHVAGLSPKKLHYFLLSLLTLTIVMAMQVVGVILVVAMLISPGMTAYLLTKQFYQMVTIAIFFSLLSSFLGLIVSYYLDASPGACIILIQAIFFMVVLALVQLKNKIQINFSEN